MWLEKRCWSLNKEEFVSLLKEANIQLSPSEPGGVSGSVDQRLCTPSVLITSDHFQSKQLLKRLTDSIICLIDRLSRNFRQKLRRNRTPLRSRWCRWRRRTSPWSRPPTRWTSAPWAAWPEARTQRPILPNLHPAPPCQSPRCSRSCTVREPKTQVINKRSKDNDENTGINAEIIKWAHFVVRLFRGRPGQKLEEPAAGSPLRAAHRLLRRGRRHSGSGDRTRRWGAQRELIVW